MKDLKDYTNDEKREFAKLCMNNLCRSSGDEASEEEIQLWINKIFCDNIYELNANHYAAFLIAQSHEKINIEEATALYEITKESMVSDIDALKLFLITRDMDKVRLYGNLTRKGISVTNLLNDAIRDDNDNNISLTSDINSFKIAFYVEKENATIPIYILSPEDVSSLASTLTDSIMRLSENLKENGKLSRDVLLRICQSSIIEKVANKFHAVKDKDSIEIIVKDDE